MVTHYYASHKYGLYIYLNLFNLHFIYNDKKREIEIW